MSRVGDDPYAVLGLARGSDKAEVKRAFRQKALQTHPDLNSAADAAQQYDKVRRAADAILNGTEYHSSQRGHSPSGQTWAPILDRVSRRGSFGASEIKHAYWGGASYLPELFERTTQCLTDEEDSRFASNRYSYHVVEESERRRLNPSPGQQRILSLLTERKESETAQRR